MELSRQSKTSLNISSEAEVLNYTYTGTTPIEFITRIDLGDAVHGLSGAGGTYNLNAYINTVVISPTSAVNVDVGKTRAIIISKPIPIITNDIVSITVLGLTGDTNVNTTTSLRNTTPILITDVLGSGAVYVDHNFGGINNLIYEHAGQGIDEANIFIYLKSDYDAGNIEHQYIVARSVTTVGGAWAHGVMLDPGTYTIQFSKPQEFGPDTTVIVVS